MPTQKKKETVEKLHDQFSRAQSLVLSDYRGLTGSEMTEMREYFTKKGVNYQVVKNTLASIAAEDAGLEELGDLIQGPTGIAISYDDPVLPFRISKECEEEFGDFSNKGGILEGEIVGPAEVEDISRLSSRKDLYGQVAVAFQAPIQKLARTLNAKLLELINVLNQVKEQSS